MKKGITAASILAAALLTPALTAYAEEGSETPDLTGPSDAASSDSAADQSDIDQSAADQTTSDQSGTVSESDSGITEYFADVDPSASSADTSDTSSDNTSDAAADTSSDSEVDPEEVRLGNIVSDAQDDVNSATDELAAANDALKIANEEDKAAEEAMQNAENAYLDKEQQIDKEISDNVKQAEDNLWEKEQAVEDIECHRPYLNDMESTYKDEIQKSEIEKEEAQKAVEEAEKNLPTDLYAAIESASNQKEILNKELTQINDQLPDQEQDLSLAKEQLKEQQQAEKEAGEKVTATEKAKQEAEKKAEETDKELSKLNSQRPEDVDPDYISMAKGDVKDAEELVQSEKEQLDRAANSLESAKAAEKNSLDEYQAAAEKEAEIKGRLDEADKKVNEASEKLNQANIDAAVKQETINDQKKLVDQAKDNYNQAVLNASSAEKALEELEASLKEAQALLESVKGEALKELQNIVDELQAQYNLGALGFYDYLAENGETTAIRNDAKRAAEVLRDTTGTTQDGKNRTTNIAGSTHIGSEDDATSLKNMLKAIADIEECNDLRAEEGTDPESGNALNPLLVNSSLMAIAQKQANQLVVKYGHSQAYSTGENIAYAGTSRDLGPDGYKNNYDPFDGWYTEHCH